MRRMVLFALVSVLFAASAQAAGYAFDIKVTDARSAILARPDHANMGMTPEQIERAAGSRVIVLDSTAGAHWKWLMLSWFDNDPGVEQCVNGRGAASPEKADFGLASGRLGYFRLRCLRDECGITLTAADERESAFTVKRGAWSPDLPLGSRVTLAFR